MTELYQQFTNKTTASALESNNDFISLAVGTVIVKNTGEEYKKTRTNVWTKTNRSLVSTDSLTDYAKLSANNDFKADQNISGSLYCTGTVKSAFSEVVGEAQVKTLLVSDTSQFTGEATFNNATAENLPATTSTLTTISSTRINPTVSGDGQIGGSANYWRAMYAQAFETVNADVAEKYKTEKTYLNGTVLQINPNGDATEFNGGTLLGVVSTKPGVILNEEEFGQPIALCGQVPVLCDGDIKKGQFCIAHHNGKVIGKDKTNMFLTDFIDCVGIALEDSKNNTVLVKVK